MKVAQRSKILILSHLHLPSLRESETTQWSEEYPRREVGWVVFVSDSESATP